MAVLRSDDPERSRLEALGWRVVAESWAAQLVLDDRTLGRLGPLAAVPGAVVRELDAGDVPAMLALDAATVRDYPGDVATQPAALDANRAMPTAVRRGFGVLDGGDLVAMTLLDVAGDAAEVDATVVASTHRGRGLAIAVKAASLLRLANDGVRVVRTGGSADNPAIIAANQRLGFVVDERWVTLRP